MPVSPDVIDDARKLKPRAVSELLRSQYPAVYRIAYALSGRWDVGRGIARFVLARSVRMMPKWDPEDDPANWFQRFTIMVSRRSAKHQPTAKKDVLVEQAMQPDAEYIAFVSALRQLETQQREAFLLHHGERLNGRYSALAMDCSIQAAETHLRAAEQSLRLVAGQKFDALTKHLADAYTHLTPADEQVLPQVSKVVFRQVKVRKWLRWFIFLFELAVLIALIWGGWKLFHLIRT